ncbi:DUF3027 domain-containing protein [Micromonospora tulbaghiae]|uniref:DUF3027 domain-containing protein n=1 Tax=Micromonospora tulbaghiae TaxID=479978 RepID=A0AAW4JP65_9ACTN|nr:DUF3027 domain-containing protein [Micromonospora tulbaghiae]MBO4143572.1 DUF3027 domain-containing protein [Micromonospora tulbaghiae]MDX5456504.1 DUF3027 domain-containing protein [Micromonospora tulbaghiae]SCE67857.1 Protein of unknown function [Micromonospora tulbaghiae]
MGNNGRVTRPASARAPRLDQVCAAAVEVARDAITEVEPTDIGDHLQAVAEGDRVVTHYFECRMAGYRGWRWAVTVTRVPRSRHVTICETVLLPGPDALLAPGWLPWQERLKPGDLGPGDLLPTPADDERLAPGYLLSDDPAVEEAAWELGLGRARVLSREGRAEAAQRWYDGDHGPDAAISVAAPAAARCGTCGFYLPLAGSLRLAFGACGNFYAPDDGRVVSADHGCGAHSETMIEAAETSVDELPTVYDDSAVEAMTVSRAPGSVATAEPAEPYGHP